MDKRIEEIRARAVAAQLLINEMHRERLDYTTEYLPLIDSNIDMQYLLDRLVQAEEKNKSMQAELIQLAQETVKRDLALARLEAEVEAAMDAQRWVPVSERLPDRGAEVLVRCAEHGMFVATRTDYDGFEYWVPNECTTYWVHEPTHWMPLPAPPKGEKNG